MAARFNYQSLPLAHIAREYAAGASWRALARKYGCKDHKTLQKHVVTAVPSLNQRTQAESQAVRRGNECGGGPALERLTKEDVTGWHDPFLKG